MRRARIAGVGSYVPPAVAGNDEVAELLGTSAATIERKTGIRQRYWNAEPACATSDLALEAARAALADAAIEPADVGYIVFATMTPDAAAPGAGCFLQKKLDLPGIPTVDVRQQCSGFLYGLSIADLYVRAGEFDHVLVVGAEMQSKILDRTPRGRSVAMLFGDGAGAVVVSGTDVDDPRSASCILSTHLHSDGSGAELLLLQHPGSMNRRFLDADLIDAPESYSQMQGRELYELALRRMPEVSHEALAASSFAVEDVDLFVIHQTNERINRDYAARMGVPVERVISTIADYGCTTAATLPIGLAEAVRSGRLEPGMLVLSCTFGSGLSWASALYRW